MKSHTPMVAQVSCMQVHRLLVKLLMGCFMVLFVCCIYRHMMLDSWLQLAGAQSPPQASIAAHKCLRKHHYNACIYICIERFATTGHCIFHTAVHLKLNRCIFRFSLS